MAKARRGHGRGRRLPKAIARDLWEAIIDTAAEERNQPLLALRDQAILSLIFFSGVRSFELVALNRDDFKQQETEKGIRTLLIVQRGKGDKERHPAVGAEAADLVEAYLDVRPECSVREGPVGEETEHHPLFVSRKHCRLSTSGVRRMAGEVEARFNASRAARDLPPIKFHLHAGRHSHITEIARAAGRKGKTLFDVAEQAGHSDLNTTRLYFAALDEDRQDLVDGM